MWRDNQQKLSPSLPEKYSFSFLPGYGKSVLSRVGWRDVWGGVRRER